MSFDSDSEMASVSQALIEVVWGWNDDILSDQGNVRLIQSSLPNSYCVQPVTGTSGLFLQFTFDDRRTEITVLRHSVILEGCDSIR